MTKQNDIIQKLIAKTYAELNQPPKPKSRSRVWKSTNGYIFLVPWSNANLLRVLGVKWLQWLKESKGNYRKLNSSNLPLNSLNKFGWKLLDRLEGQLGDCLRSTVANIEEGFARPTTSEYLQFLGYSQASLKEAKGDIQRSKQDGLLKSVPGSKLSDLKIDLKDWHEALKETTVSKPNKSKGDYGKLKETRDKLPHVPINSSKPTLSKIPQLPLNSSPAQAGFKFNYLPIDNLDPSDLTYETFIELINKTDFLLRKLVESLEKKLSTDHKYYQVEKSKIRSNLKI